MKSSNLLAFPQMLHDLTIQKNIFPCFSYSFSVPVWALILNGFGIEFICIVGPRWHQEFIFVRNRFVDVFVDLNFMNFDYKGFQIILLRHPFFLTCSNLFRRLCFRKLLGSFWHLSGRTLAVWVICFELV